MVPSPRPITIVNYEAVRSLVDAGFIVVACGGGGIPVIKENWNTIGVDAVIDKDLASEILATSIGASTLVLLTNVDGIYRNYGKKDQEFKEAIRYRSRIRERVRFVRPRKRQHWGPKCKRPSHL